LPGIQISPEVLAQALALIQSGQVAAGDDGAPVVRNREWANDPSAPIMDEVAAPNGGDHLYYHQPNGWITSGQMGKARSRMHAYRDQGWTPLLDEYGLFDLGFDYYAQAPMEVLLCRGGAKELPVEQVLALGWHLHPPLLPNCRAALGAEHKARTGKAKHFDRCWKNARPAVFPQIEGMTFTKPEECEFCPRDDFADDKVRTQHIRVAHRDEMKEIAAAREMAKQVGAVMGAAAAVGKGTSLPARLPFACGLCDEAFERPKALTDHVKLHAENVDPDAGAND
jgi:hypothetical protein